MLLEMFVEHHIIQGQELLAEYYTTVGMVEGAVPGWQFLHNLVILKPMI